MDVPASKKVSEKPAKEAIAQPILAGEGQREADARDQKSSGRECPDAMDVIRELAELYNIVVHVEQAYNLIDELNSRPERFQDVLADLSRLAAKVYADIEDAMKTCGEKALGTALKILSKAFELQEKFVRCVMDVGADKQHVNARYLKYLATLSVAPNWLSYRVRDLLWSGCSGRRGEGARSGGGEE